MCASPENVTAGEVPSEGDAKLAIPAIVAEAGQSQVAEEAGNGRSVEPAGDTTWYSMLAPVPLRPRV